MLNWDKIHSQDIKYKSLNNIFLDKILSKAKALTKHNPGTIIDLGCGSGEYLKKFIKKRLDVTGVDFSKVAIKKSRGFLEDKAKLITLDLENIKDIQGKYDLIFCKDTFAFIKNKEKFLKDIKDLMNENSILILITPVLHKEIEYTKLDKPNIAIDFTITKDLLQNNFSNVIEFYHHYTGENIDITTFMATK